MDLLFVLASHAGQVVTREQLMARLWPGLVVGEDSLARTVSKLRQSLGEDAKAPQYIETIAKRGYRLRAQVEAAKPMQGDLRADATAVPRRWTRPVVALLGVGVLLALGWAGVRFWPVSGSKPAADGRNQLVSRADDYYYQFSRADNESAIDLYQRVLGMHPDDAPALAGLANALAQRSIRWPQQAQGEGKEFTKLGDALASGYLENQPAREQLQRARQLAERAVMLAPDSAAAHKALGFVLSAQRQFAPALASYHRAVALDPDAWGSMINMGDVMEITGRDEEALPWFEQAYAAMGRAYDRNPVQVRPWYSDLGVLIADRYRARGDSPSAEAWYRRVLAESPLHPAATVGLARLMRKGGDPAAADRLCVELKQRSGETVGCEADDPPEVAR
ncbi:MAG: tetratricopeptide repeat protein [Lysobacteraceae bacterium]|nr:MAG: tetratricopeptide repeat protein [Xanthomonadaceae bacterium]